MNEKDYQYREEHGVLPQLDFVNYENPYDNLKPSPIEHSKYADLSTAKTTGVGGAVKGFAKASFGLLGAFSGGGMMGTAMASEGVGDMIRGIGNQSLTHQVASDVTNAIIESEEEAWKYLDFIRTFQPAEGNIGDIIFKDGSCDDFHCGNGHRFFDNGDYFEGYFEDGEIKKGIYIYADGTRYLGEFDDDKGKTGTGLTLFNDGSYYFGEYQQNRMHGNGYRLYIDGAFSGVFLNDERYSGALKLENGTCFFGQFENDQPVQ